MSVLSNENRMAFSKGHQKKKPLAVMLPQVKKVRKVSWYWSWHFPSKGWTESTSQHLTDLQSLRFRNHEISRYEPWRHVRTNTHSHIAWLGFFQEDNFPSGFWYSFCKRYITVKSILIPINPIDLKESKFPRETLKASNNPILLPTALPPFFPETKKQRDLFFACQLFFLCAPLF